MTTCILGTGDDSEEYTCPSQPWDTENIYCCGLNVAKICCAEDEYHKIAEHSPEFAKWELLGHVLSLTLLVVVGITFCLCCYCCPCCPAFRHRQSRGRVIRPPDPSLGMQMRPMVTMRPPQPAPPGGSRTHPLPPISPYRQQGVPYPQQPAYNPQQPAYNPQQPATFPQQPSAPPRTFSNSQSVDSALSDAPPPYPGVIAQPSVH